MYNVGETTSRSHQKSSVLTICDSKRIQVVTMLVSSLLIVIGAVFSQELSYGSYVMMAVGVLGLACFAFQAIRRCREAHKIAPMPTNPHSAAREKEKSQNPISPSRTDASATPPVAVSSSANLVTSSIGTTLSSTASVTPIVSSLSGTASSTSAFHETSSSTNSIVSSSVSVGTTLSSTVPVAVASSISTSPVSHTNMRHGVTSSTSSTNPTSSVSVAPKIPASANTAASATVSFSTLMPSAKTTVNAPSQPVLPPHPILSLATGSETPAKTGNLEVVKLPPRLAHLSDNKMYKQDVDGMIELYDALRQKQLTITCSNDDDAYLTFATSKLDIFNFLDSMCYIFKGVGGINRNPFLKGRGDRDLVYKLTRCDARKEDRPMIEFLEILGFKKKSGSDEMELSF